mmetsp:Transcript_12755/g.24746  ORF Transcript_12755/g.24746 Transcript_12755/m.24746 type:complete len:184 (+) Transcript_12755:420-971(+)
MREIQTKSRSIWLRCCTVAVVVGSAVADECTQCVKSGFTWCAAQEENSSESSYCLSDSSGECSPTTLSWQSYNSRLDCMYGNHNGEILILPIVLGFVFLVGVLLFIWYLVRLYAPSKLSDEDAERMPEASQGDARVRAETAKATSSTPASSPTSSAATMPEVSATHTRTQAPQDIHEILFAKA